MSNLKDTDFDDLFRRASDKYPLRTDSSDWDRMAAALERDPGPDTPDETDNTDKRRRRRFFWLFLLLPLAGIGYYVTHPSGHAGNSVNAANTTNAATATSAVAKSNPAANAGTNASTNANAGTKANAGTNANASTNANAGASTVASTITNAAATQPATTHNGSAVRSAVPVITIDTTRDANGAGHTTKNQSSGKNRSAKNNQPGVNNQFADDRVNDGNTIINPNTNPIAASFTLKNASITEQRARIAGPYAVTADIKAPKAKPAENKNDSTKKAASAKKKSSHIYAGIIAAPDLSTVKLQKATGVGDTYGILIGYAFNDHWALETGAYVDRKRYYTDGEYFSTSKVQFNPNYYKLLNVDGTCYMWEIPLNVRYTLNPSSKTRWFATAGFSTYLMNHEKYNYAFEYNNGTWPQTKAWDIKKNSNYPFSVIGVSFGFEQRLGKVGNLRVEPYVRLPLGGIGTGSLPIMSTGINIGITRTLWKKH